MDCLVCVAYYTRPISYVIIFNPSIYEVGVVDIVVDMIKLKLRRLSCPRSGSWKVVKMGLR
jgi:hypothetical protein